MDDTVEVVNLRKDFYRDSYRKVVVALLLAVSLIAVLGGALFYIVVHPPVPQYFAATDDGRLTPLIPLDQPNLSPSALLQWANTAAISAFTYNFVNYRQELQAASQYFTPDGWDAFISALNASGNLENVIAKKLIVSAVATQAPVILDQGKLSNVYTWKVQMPILISYQSASESTQQPVTVTMLITRIPSLNSAKGIGIAQFSVAYGAVT